MWEHRVNLSIGFVLMLIGRLAGLVLPTTSKYFIDKVVNGGQVDLLPTLAIAGGLATVVQSATSFTLSQVISVTAQKAITTMRKDVMSAIATGALNGVPMPAAAGALTTLSAAVAGGLGARDLAEVPANFRQFMLQKYE